MAFSITGPADLTLEPGAREGKTTFTVTNLTGRDVRARLMPMAEQGAEQGWLSVEGPPEVPIPVGGTITATVNVAVAARAPAGSAMIRLDVVPEDDTESQVRGPVVSFEVPASARARGMAVLLILLIVLVLALVGGGAYYWFVVRDKPAAVPSESPSPTASASKSKPVKPSKSPSASPSESQSSTPTPPKTDLTWGNWRAIGSDIVTGPAIAYTAPGRLEVFAGSPDDSIRQFTKQGTSWGGPVLPLGMAAQQRPAVVATGPQQFLLAYLQPDGSIAAQIWNGGWSPAVPLTKPPPGIASSPTLCSWGPDRIDLFARAGDNHIWQRTWTGSWGDWEQLPGEWVGAPTCIAPAANQMELFARDGFNHLKQLSGNGTTFSAPKDLGAGMVQDVAATSSSVDRLDLFTYDGGDGLRHRYWNGTAWTEWTTIKTGIADVPGAVATAEGRIAVVARDPGNSLLYMTGK